MEGSERDPEAAEVTRSEPREGGRARDAVPPWSVTTPSVVAATGFPTGPLLPRPGCFHPRQDPGPPALDPPNPLIGIGDGSYPTGRMYFLVSSFILQCCRPDPCPH